MQGEATSVAREFGGKVGIQKNKRERKITPPGEGGSRMLFATERGLVRRETDVG